MFGNFQENFHSADVKPTGFETSDHRNKFEIPTLDDLKSKMEHIFNPQGVPEKQTEVPAENSFSEHDKKTITLDDGTVINLPERPGPVYTHKADSIDTQQKSSSSEVSQRDVKPIRELTKDDKTMLQETLGWTDKQISKCTIDEDSVIHYKTDREDMEGKTGENGINYERKTVDIHGIKVQGVFPVFESVCDVQLPEDLEKASNARQFRECNNQLKENIANDPELRASFTEEQLEESEDGDTPSGYVWHHNEETGKMQLVKVEDHDRTQGGAAHTGGKALWGGSYSNHETSTTTETDATQYSISDKEVE